MNKQQLAGAALALGGLLALTACGGGAASATHPDHAPRSSDSVRASTPLPAADVTSPRTRPSARQRAVHEAHRVIAALPVAPGTRRTSHGRRYGLGGPGSHPASSHLIDRGRVWVGRGDVADAKAYIAAHLPPGFTQSGTGTVSGPDGVESTQVDYDLGGRWQQPRAFTPMTVEFTFTQTGDEVGVRADAQTTWLSSRTPAQHLPLDVTGVAISTVPHPDYRRSRQHRVHLVRGAATARRLARALDHLRVAPSGIFNCPLQLNDDQTVLVFHGPSGELRVTYEPTGCGGVTIPGGPGLEADAAFTKALHRATRPGAR